MYEHLFPKICKALSPDIFYWPASPSSGGGFDEPNDPNRGDVHYWSVWHGNKPFSDYRNFFFRFASEFGFQSFPEMKTIESFTLPEDRNAFSHVMEKHQRSGSANGKIVYYLSQTYLYPGTLEGLVYASQLLQADAIKYGVEHWRRNRGRCMGAIYWQLNDCWPVASWASVDYFGRWKALHYAAKRFFAPVLLSAEETGVMDQQPNINAELFDIKKSARLSVSNETLAPFSGRVNWALRRPDASMIESGGTPVEVPPLSAVWLDALDFPDAPLYESYLSYELTDANGAYISSETVLFCMPKHFRFADPGLTVHVAGDEVTVSARAYAKYVELYSPDTDFVLSDNFLDLNAEARTVKVLRGEAKNLRARSVYDIR
jgi:beta-mannosidase